MKHSFSATTTVRSAERNAPATSDRRPPSSPLRRNGRRRTKGAVVVLMVCASLVSACGGNDATSDASPTSATESAATTSTESVETAPTVTSPELLVTANLRYKDAVGWSWELNVTGETFLAARKIIEFSPPGSAVAEVTLLDFGVNLTNLDTGRIPPDARYALTLGFDTTLPDVRGEWPFDACFSQDPFLCEIGIASSQPDVNGPRLITSNGSDGSGHDVFVFDETSEESVDALVTVLNGPPRYLYYGPDGSEGCYFMLDFVSQRWSMDQARSVEGCTFISSTNIPVPGSTESTAETTTLDVAAPDAQTAIDGLAAMSGSIDSSKLITGACGTWGMLVLSDHVELYEWTGSSWDDRSGYLGDDSVSPPMKVTSADYTGDGLLDYLVTYDGTVGGGRQYGGIFSLQGCSWEWLDFVSLSGEYSEVLDGLAYDRASSELTASDYLPEGGRTEVMLVWDQSVAAFYAVL